MIPARFSSVRLKLKNMALINSKPMISYSILAAKESGIFDKVFVNSDHEIFMLTCFILILVSCDPFNGLHRLERSRKHPGQALKSAEKSDGQSTSPQRQSQQKEVEQSESVGSDAESAASP